MSTDTISLPPHRRSRLLGGAAGELSFAVLTGEHRGQEIQIRGPKCTIGSARGCTLRLRARGVAAIHCWILRGAGGTVVRRRHRNTQLNGQAFDDAPLKPGDRLRIGSVELEVRQCPVLPADWTEATAIAAPAYDEVDRQLWERTAQVSAETIDRLQAELQEIERRAASQLAEQSELAGRLMSERDALQERVRQLESAAPSQQDLLASDKLAGEKLELEAALAALRQELAELRSQAANRQAELEGQLQVESRRATLSQLRLDEVLGERAALEAKLQDQLNKVHGPNVDRQAELERMQDECRRLNEQVAQLRELLGYTSSDRDRALREIEETQHRLLKQQQQLEVDKKQLAHDLEQARSERTAFEAQLRAETNLWQGERTRLVEHQERMNEHSRQLEGQLTHVRGLVETLAAERDSLCQQLEAADLKQSSEHENFQAQRAAMEERISAGQQQVSAFHNHLAELSDQLTAQRQRGEEAAAQLAEAQSRAEAAAAALVEQTERAERAERQLAELPSDSSRMTVQLAGRTPHDEEAERQVAESQAQLTAAAEQLAVAERRIAELEAATASQLVWQHEAQQARDELAGVQTQLADAQTQLADFQVRLEAERAEAQSHARTEHEQRMEWERRAGELQYQLAAAELRIADAENRLEALRAQAASAPSRPAGSDPDQSERLAALTSQVERLQAELARARTLEAEAARSSAARETAESQLAEFKELVQAEREALHRDRDRVHQECRVLGHKLIQKQKELDALQEQVRAATASQSDSSRQTAGTITMQQIHRQFEAAAAVEEERNTWFGERDQLRREIEQLRKQVEDGNVDAGGLTLGSDELSKLRGMTSQSATQTLSLLQPAPGRASDELESERQALAQDRSQLAAEREQFAAEREQLAAERRQLETLTSQTQAQRAELQASQDELESRWRDWEDKLRDKERLLDERAQELTDKLASDNGPQIAPPPDESLLPSLTEHEAALQEAQSQIAELQAALSRLRERDEPVAAEPPELPPETRRSTSSIQDIAEVDSMLSKLVETGVWQGDGPAADIARTAEEEAPPAGEQASPIESDSPGEANNAAASAVPEHCAPQFAAEVPPTEDPQPVWNQPDAAAPPEDDDSIEAYMSRLLKRVRGDAPGGVPNFAPAMAPIAPAPKPAPAPPPAAAPQAQRPVVRAPQPEPEPEPEPVQPAEYLPRQKAPEHSTDLEAMRELANSAARGAIVKAQKRSGGQKALVSTIGAAMTLTCALGTGYWAWRANSVAASAATAIGVIAAFYWGGRALRQGFRAMLLTPQMLKGKTLVRRRKDRKDNKPLPAAESLPAEQSIAGDSLPLELIPTADPPPERSETLSPD